MSRLPTARTRLLALLGDPVSHSLSPVIQNAAMEEKGFDGVYVAIRAGAEEMIGLLRGIARTGGGGNVTLPHKEKAATVIEVPAPAVRRTGACNTYWLEGGKIHGDNTDVEGFARAVKVFLGSPPKLSRVLVLGAGGTARACLVALMELGAQEVHLLNRTRDRARAVARRIGGEKVRVLDDRKAAEGESYDLVVNTTRLGLVAEDPLPLDLEALDRVGGVMDLVYGPEATPFVRSAKDRGVRATDGIEMLLQQGAVAFERWWGEPPSLETMRSALETFLRR